MQIISRSFVDVEHNVTWIARALLRNDTVNLNNRETVFYAVRAEQKHGYIGSLLSHNAAVNMHPQQWETVFSVGSVQRSYLKN
jgi:hypothetical protein